MRKIPFSLLFLLVSASLVLASPSPNPTAAQWQEDLDQLVETLEEVHPDLFARTQRESFLAEAGRLKREIPQLASSQIVVRMMQLVARLKDGHTSLESGFDLWFPLRFYRFTDGIFVTAVAESYGGLAGVKVTRIGAMPAEQAWELSASLLGADNEFGSLQRASLYLSSAQALHALGVIEDPRRLTLELSRGMETSTVTMDAVQAEFDLEHQFWGEHWGPASSQVTYVTAFDGLDSEKFYDPQSDLPLHLRCRTAHWFNYDEASKRIYAQINVMSDSRRGTFDDFLLELWETVDGSPVDLFVLDLRYNIGGDGSLVQKLVHGIIKREKINRDGRLFTIVGRATFSAGVMLAAELDRHTETVFVGEPMGAYYKHYGDGTSFRLQHSGLQVWVSTIYHQLDSYTGDRRWLPIQLPAPFSSTDYFSGADPAMERILGSRSKPTLTQLFREQGAVPALEQYEERRKEFGGVAWWAPFTMAELNSLGNGLRKAGRQEDAIAAYRLNARRHPDHWRVWYSLGRAYKEQGKVAEAIEHYEKALAVDPFNNLAPYQREALEELRSSIGRTNDGP